MIRIIGGRWRGRKMMVVEAPTLRPTPDRVRETLFNWLQAEITDARCLDLFAGTGALGIEALSRGAQFVTFCENNHRAASQLHKQLAILEVKAMAEILCINANTWIQKPAVQPYDIIFCDPPFRKRWAVEHLEYLIKNKFVHQNSLVYLETEQNFEISALSLWAVVKERVAGQVAYRLLMPAGGVL